MPPSSAEIDSWIEGKEGGNLEARKGLGPLQDEPHLEEQVELLHAWHAWMLQVSQ